MESGSRGYESVERRRTNRKAREFVVSTVQIHQNGAVRSLNSTPVSFEKVEVKGKS